jgi:dTMP kinase
MKKAKLIVIDGADNSGKATQTELLRVRLASDGFKVGTMDFPRYTQNTFGKLIKESLLGFHGDFMKKDPRVASALYAADRFESKEALHALLHYNDVVVLDRYVSANMLHQGAKIDDEVQRREFLSWLEHIEYEIFGIPKPNMTIMLEVSQAHTQEVLRLMVEQGAKTPDMAEKDTEHQKRVRECMEWLRDVHPDWVRILCSEGVVLRSKEDIHTELYESVLETLR